MLGPDDLSEKIEPLVSSERIDQLNSLLSSSSGDCSPDVSCFFPATPFIYHFEKIEQSEFYKPHYFKTIDSLLNEIHLAALEEINHNFQVDSKKIESDDFEFGAELKKIVATLANDEKYKNKNAKPANIDLAKVVSAAFPYPDQHRHESAINFVEEYRNLCKQHKTITPFKLRCDLIERISSIRETLNIIATKFLDEPELELDDTMGLPPLLINISKDLHDVQSYYLFNKAIPSFVSHLEEAQKSLLTNAKPEVKEICIRLLEQLPEQLSLKKEKDDVLIKEYLNILKKENEPKEKKANKK